MSIGGPPPIPGHGRTQRVIPVMRRRVWIPADGWNHRAVVTEPGTVAFPLWSNVGAGALSEPARFKVSDSWQDLLIQIFNLQVIPLSRRTKFSTLLDLPEMPRASKSG